MFDQLIPGKWNDHLAGERLGESWQGSLGHEKKPNRRPWRTKAMGQKHEITGHTGHRIAVPGRPSDFYAVLYHSNILQSKVDIFWAMVFRHRFARISTCVAHSNTAGTLYQDFHQGSWRFASRHSIAASLAW